MINLEDLSSWVWQQIDTADERISELRDGLKTISRAKFVGTKRMENQNRG